MGRGTAAAGLVLAAMLAAMLAACGDGSGGSASVGPGDLGGAGGRPAQQQAAYDDPRTVLTELVHRAGQNDLDAACRLVNSAGQQSMISASGEPSCSAALRRVFEDTDPAELTSWTFNDEKNLEVSGGTADYDGYCSRTPLHNVKLSLVDRGGWVITGYDDQIGYTCGG